MCDSLWDYERNCFSAEQFCSLVEKRPDQCVADFKARLSLNGRKPEFGFHHWSNDHEQNYY